MKLAKYLSGYRPQTLAQLGQLSDKAIELQGKAYREWLAEARGWSVKETASYIAEQDALTRQYAGGLIAATVDRESSVRAEEYIAAGCVIRTVTVPSTKAREIYGWAVDRYQDGATLGWHKFPRSDAPTTYSVMLNGRCVNSFLTKSRAREWALARIAA